MTDPLPRRLREEGFEYLSRGTLDDFPVRRVTSWLTGFGFGEIAAGIPAHRDGIDGGPAHEELFEVLRNGEDRLVVGRPGAGKSTLCKQVAVEWARADELGPVLYRTGEDAVCNFGSVDALERAIDAAEGHALVGVENATLAGANRVFEVRRDHADRDVTFLFEARRADVDGHAGSPSLGTGAVRGGDDALADLPHYPLPSVSRSDVERVVEAFEDATRRVVDRDPGSLYEDLRSGARSGVEAHLGGMVLLAYRLSTYGEAGAGFVAHVRRCYRTLADPGNAEAVRDLSGFDPDLLADVGVMVALLGAAGLGIRKQYVRALAGEYGNHDAVGDEIEEILAGLEGWFLFPTDGEDDERPRWRVHELWSTLYLRELADEYADGEGQDPDDVESEPRFARCLTALFALATDDPCVHLGTVRTNVFDLAAEWPALAVLFGTSESARYEFPAAATDQGIRQAVATRGDAHFQRGDYGRAADEYERVRESASAAGDSRVVARALDALGATAFGRGSLDDAAECYQAATDRRREVDDHRGVARGLGALGEVTAERGDLDAAEEYHREGLELARDLGYRRGVARRLDSLGRIERRRGDLDASETYHRESLTISRDVGNRHGVARSLAGLGAIAVTRHDVDAAEERYRESLDVSRAVGDRRGIARALQGLGGVARQRREFDAAETYYRDSLAIARAAGNRRGVARSLDGLGLVAVARGDLVAAEEYHRDALEIARETGDRWNVARSLSYLGRVAVLWGEYDDAGRYYRDALDVARDAGDTHATATILHGLGLVACRHGRSDLGEEYLRESLDRFRETGDRRGVALTLGNLGWIAHDCGNLDAAADRYREAIDALLQVGDRHSAAEYLWRLGTVSHARGNVAVAADRYERALEQFREGESVEDAISVYRHLLKASVDRGDPAAVAEWTGEAVDFALRHHVEGIRETLEAGLDDLVPDRGPGEASHPVGHD